MISDLWLTAYSVNSYLQGYEQEIAAGIDISVRGNFTWTITQVNSSEIATSDRFSLRFVPRDTQYYPLSSYNIASPAFVIQDAATNATSTSSASATTSATASASASASASAPATSSLLPSATSAPSSGLSSGAKAGIAVGVVVGVLALAGLGFLLLAARRRRRKDGAGNARPDGASGFLAVEHSPPEKARTAHVDDGSAPAELQSDSALHEAPTLGQGFAEMSGDAQLHEMEAGGLEEGKK
ncbi:hypothetical protein MBLNU459_g1687t1 [Dothideomycetes sp. NU459]